MIYLVALVVFAVGAVAGVVTGFLWAMKLAQKSLLDRVSADQEVWRMAGGRGVLETVHHQVIDHRLEGEALRAWVVEALADWRQREWNRMVELGASQKPPPP